MVSSVKKRLVAVAKFLVAATKILSVVPNFVAVTKPFFSVHSLYSSGAENDSSRFLAGRFCHC